MKQNWPRSFCNDVGSRFLEHNCLASGCVRYMNKNPTNSVLVREALTVQLFSCLIIVLTGAMSPIACVSSMVFRFVCGWQCGRVMPNHSQTTEKYQSKTTP